jgi:hypothetical protein
MRTKKAPFALTHDLALAFLLAAALLGEAAQAAAKEPIAFIGHGVMFDSDGKQLKPTEELIESAQKYYLDELSKKADGPRRAKLDDLRKRTLEGRKWDKHSELVINAGLLEWLSGELQADHAMRGKLRLITWTLGRQLAGPGTGKPWKPSPALAKLLVEEQLLQPLPTGPRPLPPKPTKK